MMLKYAPILISFLPSYSFAETTENTIQFILDDYQAECIAAQQETMEPVQEGEDFSEVRITLDESSIYKIDLTADGKEATVLYANPSCPQIGSGWCGSSGCTSYVIVDGISFQTEGFKPVSVAVSEDSVVVIVPRSGGACVNTNDQTPPSNVSCYSVAVWDDYSQTFNSIGSGEPVFKLSDFNP